MHLIFFATLVWRIIRIVKHFWSVSQLDIWRVKLLELVEHLVVNEFPHIFDPYIGQTHQPLRGHNHLVADNAILHVPLLPNVEFNVVFPLVLRVFRKKSLVNIFSELIHFFGLVKLIGGWNRVWNRLGYFLSLFYWPFVWVYVWGHFVQLLSFLRVYNNFRQRTFWLILLRCHISLTFTYLSKVPLW